MEYLTTKETAKKWGVNVSLVRRYCTQERIPGVIQRDGAWLIPEDAKRPMKIEPGVKEPVVLPALAQKLLRQKKKKSFHGLYDYVQINLTHSSCRMASNRLTRQQVETIFRKGKVSVSFEPMKVSDLVEVLNHCVCVDYILDHAQEPLTPKFIKELHYQLVFGTVDDRRKRVAPGQYRSPKSSRRVPFMLPADQIGPKLKALIGEYEALTEVERRDILRFHVRFERIFPFEDCNGRIGRLILFKECLRHDVMPFIIDDKRRNRYLEGLREWDDDPGILTEVVMEAQSRFDAQIQLQNLYRSTDTISCRQALWRTDYEDGLHPRGGLLHPQSGTAPGIPPHRQMGQNAPPLPGNIPSHSVQSARPLRHPLDESCRPERTGSGAYGNAD